MVSSSSLYKKACTLIPGGVNSPVRTCGNVGCEPLFILSAAGARVTTVEGREMLDFVMSWGPLLMGHAHARVLSAVHAAVDKGVSYGTPCQSEVELAQAITEVMPGIEMVRMVNSGTEATMSAVRLARAFTGRSKIVKFIGCYHGHSDGFLAAAGSGVATFGIADTPGVPDSVVWHTLLAPYNDGKAVRRLFAAYDDIAAVIVEPVACNMGLVPPAPGFLETLREQTLHHGALLIFDEMITGFRLAYGGAQSVFGIDPDLTCLGKIIGGGLPVGAFGGKRHIMECVAPSGGVYQAGTLSGNPLGIAAGLATLKLLKNIDYSGLEERTRYWANDMAAVLRSKGVPVCVNQIASLCTIFFRKGPVTNFEQAARSDFGLYAAFYRQLRQAAICIAPSGYECLFTSFAHTDADFEQTLRAVWQTKF